ncbi:vesicle-fusing ATPase 2 [Drosophila teissieri]|uniref:vesicle-fusing ATPase 2 n=1 Tax=Drosophila teissieri TaxID=7243 RepID=UPI001CBA4275|nr:vesicle-fusing ATPase 2 [Drosophila teissieri]
MVNIILPNDEERLNLLDSRIKRLHDMKLAGDVCPHEIAMKTQNFTEDELRQLVLVALHEAIVRNHVTGYTEGLQVSQVDLLAAVKIVQPRFGRQEEVLQQLMPYEYFCRSTNDAALDQESLLLTGHPGLSCHLVEGKPKSGLTTVAAQMALNTDFPFVKYISSANLLGLSDSDKCQRIWEVLEDAHVSRRSCVIIDDLERIVGYGALGKQYSNELLRMLVVLLKKLPPRGHELLIICTTNRRDVLQELGLLSLFTSVRNVPNVSTPKELLAIVEASKRFEPEELRQIKSAMEGRDVSIGIKRLLELIEWVNPITPERRPGKFLLKLGEAMGWVGPNSSSAAI